jgi:hypothetical protein
VYWLLFGKEGKYTELTHQVKELAQPDLTEYFVNIINILQSQKAHFIASHYPPVV